MKKVKSYGVFILIAMAVAFFTEVKANDSQSIPTQEVVIANHSIDNVAVTITAEQFSEVSRDMMNNLSAEFSHFVTTTYFVFNPGGGDVIDDVKNKRKTRAERKKEKELSCANRVPERLRQIKKDANPRFQQRMIKAQHANVARLSKRNHR